MKREYFLGLYEKAMPGCLSWEDKLTAAREGGFDFVEISIDESDEKLARLDMSDEERRALSESMIKAGLPIRSMCLSGHRRFPLGSHDPEVRQRSIEIMEKAVNLADDLGIPVIQLAGYDVYYEQGDDETRRLFFENLHKAVLMAAKHGVMLGFETMETDFMNTVKKAMNYVDKIASPFLNVYPDAGNITNAAEISGELVTEDIKNGRGHIIAVHLKEAKPGIYRNLHFGDGDVDFESIIAASWKLGVRRFVTEFWYDGRADWQAQLSAASQCMRRILDSQSKMSGGLESAC